MKFFLVFSRKCLVSIGRKPSIRYEFANYGETQIQTKTFEIICLPCFVINGITCVSKCFLPLLYVFCCGADKMISAHEFASPTPTPTPPTTTKKKKKKEGKQNKVVLVFWFLLFNLLNMLSQSLLRDPASTRMHQIIAF